MDCGGRVGQLYCGGRVGQLDCDVVRQVSSIFQPNCAFCEESTKFGTLVEYHIMNGFGYWPISNSAYDGCDSHFSKWPRAVTVMMHICFTGEECRLTVNDYLLIKVQ